MAHPFAAHHDGARVDAGGRDLPTLRTLARRWYGDRLSPDWRPRTLQQSQAILDSVGLTGEFWRLA